MNDKQCINGGYSGSSRCITIPESHGLWKYFIIMKSISLLAQLRLGLVTYGKMENHRFMKMTIFHRGGVT
eukprot:TRINITY_DN2939_c0_g1_i1.p1 TRINITY_DN2939_c0_g1~~TRINITY_DN2939_c0_g1_i1.p1  ORF type:complete len:70 (-),score=3.90 TRINITY_DN2939_c0_g1_i1:274-483(-)